MVLKTLPSDLTIDQLSNNKQYLEDLLKEVVNSKEPKIFVNRRKIKMQKIYYHLVKEIKKHNPKVKALSIEDVYYPGLITNHCSTGFVEMDLALVILTKKHIDKELSILKELVKRKTRTLVISLNKEYCEKGVDLYWVQDTKGLYYFMYILTLHSQDLSYSQFAKSYEPTTKKLNFEEIMENEIS